MSSRNPLTAGYHGAMQEDGRIPFYNKPRLRVDFRSVRLRGPCRGGHT
ncbi:MAG: hypothetical protein AABZ70_19190 [candidate division NC10 bacterium]